MTTDTLRRKTEAVELAYRPNLVARIAINNGVRPDERESVLVHIDVVNRNLPPISVVAQLAFSTVFPPMKIRVAVLALVRYAFEVQIAVAVAARDFRMPSAQREIGLTMTEFGLPSNRLPANCRVAVLARNVEFPVRATASHGGVGALGRREHRTS
jgi:hypothetical protein